MPQEPWILRFEEVDVSRVPQVGGKNASLGELHRALVPKGVRVPGGFAVTAEAYRYFLARTGLDAFIKKALAGLDTKNLRDLARRGKRVRDAISRTPLPSDLETQIVSAYAEMEKKYGSHVDVAVRSSATAEDLPDASFAGEHETYLNIRGGAHVCVAVRYAMASLFTDRAISYRVDKGFDHLTIALSVGVQKMVRSDRGASGVMFTLDTESGFKDVIIVNASWGLGEMIVKGEVTPDEYLVAKKTLARMAGGTSARAQRAGIANLNPIISKRLGKKDVKMVYAAARGIKSTKIVSVPAKDRARFVLTEEEIATLARWGQMIEDHYSECAGRWTPMDMEWAKDGITGELYIVQARPETVHARRDFSRITEYVRVGKGSPVAEGASVGSKIAVGNARVILDEKNMADFERGEVLVTDMTSPDWEPTMKLASAIVTDKGGRTCFGGETKILTDRGFLSMEEVFTFVQQGTLLMTLSLDAKNKKVVWRAIQDASVREGTLAKVFVAPTIRSEQSFIFTTLDHTFFTLDNRGLDKVPISEIINSNRGVLSADRIPAWSKGDMSANNWYVLGALVTDGFSMINKQGGYVVGFTQKCVPEKEDFIAAVQEGFRQSYGHSLSTVIDKRGNWGNFMCYRKEVYNALVTQKRNLLEDLLSAAPEDVQKFLGGVIDGDGNLSAHQIQVTVGENKKAILDAIVVASLRLGILPTICKVKTWFVASFDKAYASTLLRYATRVKYDQNGQSKVPEIVRAERKKFISNQIINDVISYVNRRGSIRHSYLVRNNMLTGYTIRGILDRIKDGSIIGEFNDLLASDVTMQKARYSGQRKENADVYNLTIDANSELDHNYVVFTSTYIPVVVGNCHAAIVSRELGIPCVVGTGNATRTLKTGEMITVDTTGSTGQVFHGTLKFSVMEHDVKNMPQPETKVMVNIATPDTAFAKSFLPNSGVGLAREEFIIASEIGIHPMALLNFRKLPAKIKREIERRAAGFKNREEFYIRTLAYGIARIAAAFDPHPVIARFSDFKTNEYRSLLGGEFYEPAEENPMIGWRGASRYYDPKFRPAFALECRAMKMVREEMGFANVIPMIPFCRTLEEADKALAAMAEEGLDRRNDNSLKIYMMCEIPSNVILAEQFLERFDGMSIGSNDLTQLALGLDRDAGALTHIGNENNDAVRALLAQVIRTCRVKGKYIGICGQGPSDYPELAEFLVRQGIESISLNPDTVIATTMRIYETEKKMKPVLNIKKT